MKPFVPILLAAFAAQWLAAAEDDSTNASDPAPLSDTKVADAEFSAARLLQPEAAAAPLEAGVTPTNGIILNFHEAPLNSVLNYLSAKVGLIIISDVDLKGKVTVVAKQPVATNELVDLLSAQLARNNYAVTLNGRTLTVMDAAQAKSNAFTPVLLSRSGPANIPRNDQVVTEILPLSSLPAAQLVKDLTPLIPAGDTVTPNESGNAIIMTAPQKDVHRMAEMIAALDSSAQSAVAVFPLKFADAKSVASELKEVFQTSDSQVTRAGSGNTFGGGGPGGPGFGPPGFFGGGNNNGNSSSDSTKNSETHTVFVSDDQMNAVVASTPPDYMATVSNVIFKLDVPNQDITQIRVFQLKHADPSEIADELSSLFPSNTGSSDQNNNRSMGFQFNPFGQGGGSGASSQSARAKRQSTVLAVADRRTQSVIVTASKDLMAEIKAMVVDLDEGSAGVQHVYALALESADPSSVDSTLNGLFAGSQSRSQTSTTTALQARMTANANSQSSTTSTTSGFGSSSSGSGSSGSH